MKILALALTAVCVSAAAAPTRAADEAAIRAALTKLSPEASIERIRASSMPGLTEVVAGGQVLYVSDDGRYVINGTLIDAAEAIDLTERSRTELRARTLAGMPTDARIRFEPSTPARNRVTVFTAVDCGFCRRFHADIDAYLEADIAVDYVLIPLGGPNTAGYATSARVHCAKDRRAAFTAATFGNEFEAGSCESSYLRGVEVARALGIGSTPTIIADDGSRLGGYLTPAQLRAALDAKLAGG